MTPIVRNMEIFAMEAERPNHTEDHDVQGESTFEGLIMHDLDETESCVL